MSIGFLDKKPETARPANMQLSSQLGQGCGRVDRNLGGSAQNQMHRIGFSDRKEGKRV